MSKLSMWFYGMSYSNIWHPRRGVQCGSKRMHARMGMGQGLYLGLYLSDLDFSCGRINERTDGLRGQEALADLKIAKK